MIQIKPRLVRGFIFCMLYSYKKIRQFLLENRLIFAFYTDFWIFCLTDFTVTAYVTTFIFILAVVFAFADILPSSFTLRLRVTAVTAFLL